MEKRAGVLLDNYFSCCLSYWGAWIVFYPGTHDSSYDMKIATKYQIIDQKMNNDVFYCKMKVESMCQIV